VPRIPAADRVLLATRTEAPVTPEMLIRFQDEGTLKELHEVFVRMTDLAARLDLLKKHLFYGKDYPCQKLLTGLTNDGMERVKARFSNPRSIRVIHALIGLATELGGETIEAAEAHFFQGKELDETNLKEEMGDADWYLNLLCSVLGTTMEMVEIANIKKLVGGRYKDKFSQDEALLRDLGKERQILEDNLKPGV